MQEKELQKHIDDKIKKVDELLENKEIEIMKV
jgi:ribosome recycling factor